MLFGADDVPPGGYLIAAIAFLGGILVWLFKVEMPSQRLRQEERLDKKDAECREERELHREERQQESALNRDMHHKTISAIDRLTDRLDRGSNRNAPGTT